MNGNMDSDPGFRFLSSATQHNMLELPSSSSNAVNYGPKPKPRKKRSKLINVDVDGLPTCSTVVSRPKYAKKPDPAAPKITPPCSECGKKFWSWKALFGHMRCHPERQWRGINPPPNHSRPVKPTNNVEALMTEDDHEIAASLLLLANGTAALSESECGTSSQPGVQETEAFPEHMGAKYPFECSSCKKVFGSHQALGGHRASHKNVKGCFAITRSDDCDIEDRSCDEDGLVKENVDNDSSKLMMVLGHKCSICLKVFTSGQALGGHKRCHWDKGDEPSLSHGINLLTPKEDCGLDLNLPAPIENDPSSSSSYSSSLALDLRLSL